MRISKLLTGTLLAGALIASTGCNKLKSRDDLNKGVARL